MHFPGEPFTSPVLTDDNLCGGRSPVRSVPGHPLGERQLEKHQFLAVLVGFYSGAKERSRQIYILKIRFQRFAI